jgi:L,D-transpeptidase catalytic domain
VTGHRTGLITSLVRLLPLLALVGATALPASVEAQPSVLSLETDLLRATPGLHAEALHAALASWDTLSARGEVHRPVLAVIDYGLPSTEKRMWVLDLSSGQVLFHELVAHGRNSGDNLAQFFSNDGGTYMSSLGAFVTGETYDGRNGYSLRLRGIEPSLNDRAEERAIVMHGAPYVDDGVARSLGRLGRSLGCPAVRPAVARELIDEIKDGSVLYVWHPSLAH